MSHFLITGPTGAGKSYALYGQLHDIDGRVPYLLITPKEDTCRFLIDPAIADRVIRFEELRLSLFSPPDGVDAEQWHLTVVELICRVWRLQFSRSVLHQCVDELRHEFETKSQSAREELSFTILDLLERVRTKKGKYSEGAATVLDMLHRATGPVFECSQGWDIHESLLSGSTILLIPHIADDSVARFIVDWAMEYSYADLRTNGPDDGSPQLYFAIDDAHRFLSAKAEKDALTTLSHKYLIVRQAGIRIMAVSQCPEDLAPAVISQSNVILQVGGLAHEDQVRTMGRAFGLKQQDWGALKSVNRGEFIALERLGRYHNPLSGQIKRFPTPTRPFTESDRLARMKPILDGYSWKPRLVSNRAKSSTAILPPPISNEAMSLALDVLSFPYEFMTARYHRLGNKKGRAANRLKQELLDQGWVREYSIPLRRGKAILLEPLAPLAAGLNRPLPRYGKGGFLHAFLQHTVAEKIKQTGFTSVQKEKFYGPKGVDLVGVSPSGNLYGFEITVSKSNVIENFEKDFAAQPRFAGITAVCLSAGEARVVLKRLKGAPSLKPFLSRIEALPVAHWL